MITSIVSATLKAEAERRFGNGELFYRLTVPLTSITDWIKTDEDRALATRIIETKFKS